MSTLSRTLISIFLCNQTSMNVVDAMEAAITYVKTRKVVMTARVERDTDLEEINTVVMVRTRFCDIGNNECRCLVL